MLGRREGVGDAGKVLGEGVGTQGRCWDAGKVLGRRKGEGVGGRCWYAGKVLGEGVGTQGRYWGKVLGRREALSMFKEFSHFTHKAIRPDLTMLEGDHKVVHGLKTRRKDARYRWHT